MRKLVIIISVLFFMGCEKVLDKKPLDIISDVSVWTDKVMIDDYLTMCYSDMYFLFDMPLESEWGYPYGWIECTYESTIADEAMVNWNFGSEPGSLITVKGGVLEWWGYDIVRRLNILMEKLEPLTNFDAEYKKQRLAEARFLRAFAYFNMVKRYGGVPLITKSQELTDAKEVLFPKRNKEAEIYNFILSELDAIAPDLLKTLTAKDLGRATYYAALALKSRAAMFAGSIASWGTVALDGVVGIPKSEAPRYWQASYDASSTIITSKIFSLYNKVPDKAANFRNIFLDKGNSETIFSERFDGLSGKGHSWDMWQLPWGYHVWGGGQKSSLYLEMVESFDNIDGTPGIIDRNKIASGYGWTVNELWGKKDPRFKASVYTHGTSWLNGEIVLDYSDATLTPAGETKVGSYKGVLTHANSANAKTPFGILKYLDEAKRAKIVERLHSDTDYLVFRLGEIYLNYAEAAIELNKNGDALTAVNELRKRAGVAEYTAITRDLVRKERKVELAFEGNRYWDVRRWRTAVTDLTKNYRSIRFIRDGSSFEEGAYDVMKAKYKIEIVNDIAGIPGPYFVDQYYYLPINLRRTTANPSMVENPGYK